MQKTRHAAVDGVTMFEIISAIHDLSPDAAADELDTAWKPETEPPSLSLLGRAVVKNSLAPARVFRALMSPQPGARERRMRQRLDIPDLSAAPRTRFSGAVSGHRVIDACRFSSTACSATAAK